jgi:hypothetical protein
MNINRIINESINKVLLENAQAQFQQLSACLSALEGYRLTMTQTNISDIGNQQIINFISNNFYNFIVCLETALKRCINAGAINEGLNDIGIQVPQELSSAWYAAKRGYYNANNTLNRWLGLDRTNNKSNAWNNSNNKIAQSKYVKLSELLDRQWPEIKKYYEKYNQGYTISKVCPAAENAKKTIEQIVQLVQQIKNNAQGTNP